jgi:hypothetical protein
MGVTEAVAACPNPKIVYDWGGFQGKIYS